MRASPAAGTSAAAAGGSYCEAVQRTLRRLRRALALVVLGTLLLLGATILGMLDPSAPHTTLLPRMLGAGRASAPSRRARCLPRGPAAAPRGHVAPWLLCEPRWRQRELRIDSFHGHLLVFETRVNLEVPSPPHAHPIPPPPRQLGAQLQSSFACNVPYSTAHGGVGGDCAAPS